MKSSDWWLGRTPEWRARQDKMRSAGEGMKSVGRSWTIMTLAVVGTLVMGGLLVGIPIAFGIASAVFAPSRGRGRLPAYTLGVWLPGAYLLYLLTRPTTDSEKEAPVAPPPDLPGNGATRSHLPRRHD